MKPLLQVLWAVGWLVVTALGSAATGWVGTQKSGDVAYFLTATPPGIRRFDLAQARWLDPLSLKATPTAFLVETNALYVAFGTVLDRYTPELTDETPVFVSSTPIQTVLAWSNYVYAVHPQYPYGYVTSIRKSDSVVLARGQFTYKAFVGASVSASLGRIYGRQSGISPSDIDTLPLLGDGTLGLPQDSPYHGAYPDAHQTYVLGDGLRVLDDSGTLYEGDTLHFAGSLGGAVDAVDFHAGTVPIVLRGSQVLAYSKAFLPTGSVTSSLVGPKGLFVQGTNVLVFAPTADGIAVESIPISALKPEKPGEAIDPRGLDYTPDAILAEASGDLVLYSRSLRSLFRWSRSARDYQPTIPLVGAPAQVAYSALANSVYLGFDSGRIDRVPLAGDPVQAPFATSGAAILGLAVADPFVFACNAGGPWVTHETFGTNGIRISSRAWSQFSREYIWSPADRRIYYFRDDTSPNDLLAEVIGLDGQLGAQSETPYHGEVGAVHPIRVSQDARRIVLGSGELYEGVGLTKAGNLPVTLADAAWQGANLYTVRTVASNTFVQAWSTNGLALQRTVSILGSPLRLFADDSGVTLVALQDGRPRFHLLGLDLARIFSSPVPPATPTDLGVTNVLADAVTLTWKDGSDNEDGFQVEMLGRSDGEWHLRATTPANAVQFTVEGLDFASTNTFRIRATNAAGASAYVGPLSVVTLPDPRGPAPAKDLTLVEALSTRVELSWTDAAGNEDGYRVERVPFNPFEPPQAWVSIATLPANTTTYADTGLAPSSAYLYRVVAYNAFVAAEPSPVVAAVLLSRDDLPPSMGPGSLRVVSASGTEVRLAWTDDTSSETGFRLERAPLPGGAWQEVGRVGRNRTNFTDATVQPGILYGYRLIAFNAYGDGFPPGQAEVRTPAVGGNYLGLCGRLGTILCFAFDAPYRVERQDTATGQWLTPIPLAGRPTAIAPAAEGLYVAFDAQLARVAWTDGGATSLGTAADPVATLFLSSDLLYAISRGNQVLWVDRQTGIPGGTVVASTYPFAPRVAVTADGLTMFAVTRNVSPADIFRVQFSPTGGIVGSMESPYHGSFPIGDWAAVSPDAQRVLTSSGIVYRTSDLRYVGSLGGPVDAIAFATNGAAVAARGMELMAYDTALRETGRLLLTNAPVWLAVDGLDVITFTPDLVSPHGLESRRIPVASLVPKVPEPPPAFTGRAFRPDDAFVAADGDTLVLFSAEHHALFRWSLGGRKELPGIGLLGAPSFVAYSAASNRVYTAYPTGQLRQVDLVPGSVETPFASLPQPPMGLAVAGPFVFAADPSGAWGTHYVFGADGTLLDSREWNHRSRQYTWSPSRQRMYFFRDEMTPNDLHWETIDAKGLIAANGESPYHGEVSAQVPIRVKADGSVVLLGSGQMLDATTLTFTGTLANPVVDADWHANSLFSVRGLPGGTQVQRWSAIYSPMATRLLEGEPLRVWPLANAVVVLTLDAGQPRITLLDEALAVTYQSPVNHAPTAIRLAPGVVGEDAPVGTVVGTFSATDLDADEAFTFSLVGGPTASFQVDGAVLRTAQPLDFETLARADLVVRVVDRGGLALEQPVTVVVTNVNEAPTAVVLSGDTIREEAPVGTRVGLVSVRDPDIDDRHELVLTDSAGGQFRLVGRWLEVARRLSFRDSPHPVVRFRATDLGGAQVESSVAIQVLELPTPTVSARVLGEGLDRLMVLDVVQPRLAYGMRYEARMSADLREWQPLLVPPTLVSSDDLSATVRYVLPAASGQLYLRVRAIYP